MKNCCLPLLESIRNKITADGFLSFADYMAMALYHPEYGYYQNLKTIGSQGDFITAPEVSPLLAKALAKQCQEFWQALGQGNILEVGAGMGSLACQLLPALHNLGIKPKKYYIFEISKALIETQKTYIKNHLPQYQSVFEWLDHPPKNFTGVLLANEVLDALPVHCFAWQNQTLLERTVVLHDQSLAWGHQQPSVQLQTATTDLPLQSINHLYESEVNLNYSPFIKTWADSLHTGAMIMIDYGYGAREYYHPERYQGTLTCFYQHQKNNNPFQNIGYQDITAHVDFTALANVAIEHDLSLTGFTTQAGFLLSCDLPKLVIEAEEGLSEGQKLQLHHAIKQLTFPTEMGEVMKVICFEKNLPNHQPRYGFKLQDRRRDL